MKIKKVNEINAKYDPEEDSYHFDPSELNKDVTFYLHKGKQGFAMEIHVDDREELEKILTKNKVNYTVSYGNVLPF